MKLEHSAVAGVLAIYVGILGCVALAGYGLWQIAMAVVR